MSSPAASRSAPSRGFLTFRRLINARTNWRRAWIAHLPYPAASRKELEARRDLEGAAVGWVLILVAHVAAELALYQQSLCADLQSP